MTQDKKPSLRNGPRIGPNPIQPQAAGQNMNQYMQRAQQQARPAQPVAPAQRSRLIQPAAPTREAQVQQIATNAALGEAQRRTREQLGAPQRGAVSRSFNPMGALGGPISGTLGPDARVTLNTVQHPDGSVYSPGAAELNASQSVNPFQPASGRVDPELLTPEENDLVANREMGVREFNRARSLYPTVDAERGGVPEGGIPAKPALRGFQRTSGAPILDPAAGLVSTQNVARGLGVGGQSNNPQIQHGSEVGYDEVADTMEPTTGSYTTPVPEARPQIEPDNYISADTSVPAGATTGVAATGSAIGRGAGSYSTAPETYREAVPTITGVGRGAGSYSASPEAYTQTAPTSSGIGRGAGSYTTPVPEPTYIKPQEDYVSNDTTPPAGSIGSVSARGGFKGGAYASTVQQAAQDFLRDQQARLARDPLAPSSYVSQEQALGGVAPSSGTFGATVSKTVLNPYTQNYNQSLAARGMTPDKASAYDYVQTFKVRGAEKQAINPSSDTSLNYVAQQRGTREPIGAGSVVDYGGQGVKASNTGRMGLSGASKYVEMPPAARQEKAGNGRAYGNSDYSLPSSPASISPTNSMNSYASDFSDDVDQHEYQTQAMREYGGNLSNTPKYLEQIVNDKVMTVASKLSSERAPSSQYYGNDPDVMKLQNIESQAVGGISKATPVNGQNPNMWMDKPRLNQRTARGIQSAEAPQGQYSTHYQVPASTGEGLGFPQDRQLDYVPQGQKVARGVNPSGLNLTSVPPTHYEIPTRGGEGLTASNDTSLNYTPTTQVTKSGLGVSGVPQGKYPTHYEVPQRSGEGLGLPTGKDYLDYTPVKNTLKSRFSEDISRARYVPEERPTPSLIPQEKIRKMGVVLTPEYHPRQVEPIVSQELKRVQVGKEYVPLGDELRSQGELPQTAQMIPNAQLDNLGYDPSDAQSYISTKRGSASPSSTLNKSKESLMNRSYASGLQPRVKNPRAIDYRRKPQAYTPGEVDSYEGSQIQGFDPAAVERGRQMLTKGKTMGQVRDSLGYTSRRDFLGRQHDKKIDMLRVGEVLANNNIGHEDVHQYLQYVNSQNGGAPTSYGEDRAALPHLVDTKGIRGASHILTRIIPKR